MERIKGETVPPVNTLRLLDSVGASRASRMLGVSTTTLHKARKHQLVSRVIEVAAAGQVAALGDTVLKAPAKRRDEAIKALFLIEIPQDKVKVMQRLAEALDAELVSAA